MYIVEFDPEYQTPENNIAFELVGTDEEIREAKEGFVAALLGSTATAFEVEYGAIMRLAMSDDTTISVYNKEEFVDFVTKRENGLVARSQQIATLAKAGNITTAQFMQEYGLLRKWRAADNVSVLRHDGVQYAEYKVPGTDRLNIMGDDPSGVTEYGQELVERNEVNWTGFLHPITRDQNGSVVSVGKQYHTMGEMTDDGKYTAVASILDNHEVARLYAEEQARTNYTDVT